MTRTGPQAIAWVETQHVGWDGECLGFTRTAFDLPLVYPRAIDAWHATVARHVTSDPNEIPAGFPIFMQGANPAGHVAVTLGGGKFYSTNDAAGGPGEYYIQNWINVGYKLLGWAEDLNDVFIYGARFGQSTKIPAVPATPAPSITPTVSEEDADMLLKHTSTTQKQALKKGVWRNLRVDDGKTPIVSLLTTGPKKFVAQVQVTVEGLPAGAVPKARFVAYTDADKKVTRDFPVTELVRTNGNTYDGLVQIGEIYKGQRLRVHITGPDGATITSSQAHTLYSA